ncbi:MAG: hypothetical protein WC796_02690 [Candidatus Pacearchaeota archaeon]|jgi:hypothetical protein
MVTDCCVRTDHYLECVLGHFKILDIDPGEICPETSTEELISLINESSVPQPSLRHYLMIQSCWFRDFGYFMQNGNQNEVINQWVSSPQQRDHHLEYAFNYILGRPLILGEESRNWVNGFLRGLSKEFDMSEYYSSLPAR